MAKSKGTPRLPFPADFDPEPTVFKGGIKRMVEIWETLREQNPGGYGGSVLQQVGTGKNKWSIHPHASQMTSCSPFTATVIGMLLDPSLTTKGDSFQPMYDNGTKPLPHDFYSMHQQNYLKQRPRFKAGFAERGWSWCDDAAQSVWFFNLGYEVEARDLRRGDLVGINWSNGGGHAVFVWDVHLDAKGDVDAFCLLSANGRILGKGSYTGAGVTIGGCGGKFYVSGERGSYAAALSPLFADREEHIKDADWWMVPGRSKKELDRSTFKGPGPKKVFDYTDRPKPLTPEQKKKGAKQPKWPFHVSSLKAARLWGLRPPGRAGSTAKQSANFELASRLGYEDSPASYATGKGAAPQVHIQRAPVVVHKGPAEKAKQAPPKPAPQDPTLPAPHQYWVEEALYKLYTAKWIAFDPGDRTNVNDAESKKAIRDFQTKFDCPPVDGLAGPITRRALRQALDDLAAGKPPPYEQPKPRRPRLDSVTWLKNRVKVGEQAFLSVHGQDLDLITTLQISLRDRRTNVAVNLAWPIILVNDVGVTPVAVPVIFTKGAELLASFAGVGSEGTSVKHEHNVPLYVGEIAPPVIAADWPWDEALWTQKMRDIIADLRATPTPTGPLERWQITQYGVKDVEPGDVEVRSASGEVFGTVTRRSLMKADIEGTMRLDGRILNITKAGNVYEPREVEVDGHKIIKRKPVEEKFDPANSLWTDVTEKYPWGAGSRTPLVPFRTLAINPSKNPTLYFKKVYIKQLDGLVLPTGETHNGICVIGDAGGMNHQHFDLCVGREASHIKIPSVAKRGHTMCEIQLLDESAVAKPSKRKKK